MCPAQTVIVAPQILRVHNTKNTWRERALMRAAGWEKVVPGQIAHWEQMDYSIGGRLLVRVAAHASKLQYVGNSVPSSQSFHVLKSVIKAF